jgi:hypothetical protein
MEVAKKNSVNFGSKRDLMLQTWHGLGDPSIGKRELRQIQSAVMAAFGPGAEDSPAAIARVLAGAGAPLRHPEVLEFDAAWRETRIKLQEKKFAALPDYPAGEPLTFEQAETLIRGFETLRQQFDSAQDQTAIAMLNERAIEARQLARSIARNPEAPENVRAEQKEVSEWLKIWIQTPNLVRNWIELRKSSPDFRRKFLDRQRPDQ